MSLTDEPSTTPPAGEAKERVDRVIAVLRQFTLLKRELGWYQMMEPEEYHSLKVKLLEAVK